MQVWYCAQRDHSNPRSRKVSDACVRCGAKDVGRTDVAGSARRRQFWQRVPSRWPRESMARSSTTRDWRWSTPGVKGNYLGTPIDALCVVVAKATGAIKAVLHKLRCRGNAVPALRGAGQLAAADRRFQRRRGRMNERFPIPTGIPRRANPSASSRRAHSDSKGGRRQRSWVRKPFWLVWTLRPRGW